MIINSQSFARFGNQPELKNSKPTQVDKGNDNTASPFKPNLGSFPPPPKPIGEVLNVPSINPKKRSIYDVKA